MKLDSEHEIYHTKEEGFSLQYSEHAIKVKEFSESAGYGIRVLENKRIGFSFGENENELPKIIEKAQKSAQFAVTSDFSFQKKSPYPSLKMADKKIKEITSEELKEYLLEVKKGVEKYTDNARMYVSTGTSVTTIENTNDLSSEYEKTSISIYVEAIKGEGFGFDSYASCFLPDSFEEIGARAGAMAQHMEHPKKIQTGKYSVIFEQEALNDLVDVLLPSFSGDWKRRKVSFLTDKENKKLFDESLNISDDATAPAANIQLSDDEGTPSKNIPLIEKGVVRGFMYDRATAALDHTDDEGACTRADFSSLPTLGNSNVAIARGTYDNLENDLREYIIVKSLHGTHTANTTTGDFGVEVNIAWHCKKNEKKPVRGFIMSGNIFTLFKEIHGIEKKVLIYGNFIAPRIACDDVQIVG